MKKYIYKFSVGTISCFLIIAAICILSTACTKEDTATKKIDNKSKSFSLAPYECNIIGEINVAELSKLDSAKKQIESNKNTAFVKELDNAGMGWNNISRIYFAISPPSQIQDNNNPPPPSALILLKSNNKIDIEKLIPIVERETKKKVTSEKIDKQTVYLISLDNNELVCLSELTDNLVAIGTKSIITKTIDLFNGKGKSVVDNAQLMKLSDNAKCDNMFWISGVVDKSCKFLRNCVNKNGSLKWEEYESSTAKYNMWTYFITMNVLLRAGGKENKNAAERLLKFIDSKITASGLPPMRDQGEKITECAFMQADILLFLLPFTSIK